MREFLYDIIRIITKIHSVILSWNDGYEGTFTDKELHFWVVGIVGIALLLFIYPLFKLLAEHHVLIIAWLYVFTLLIGMTFAIEIGQGYTGTGVMDFEDVVSGLSGFMYLFIIFAVVRFIWNLIGKIFGSIVRAVV